MRSSPCVWSLLFLCHFSHASQIIPVQLSSPRQMCAEVVCLEVGPGEVGVYHWPALKNPLAYATLTRTLRIADITLPKGTKITFKDPASADHFGTNFSASFPEAQVKAGVALKGNEIGFNRFKRIWDTEAKEHKWIPKENGYVQVHGILNRDETIEAIPLRQHFPVVFETTVKNLDSGHIDSLRLNQGLVAKRSEVPAEKAIELQPNDQVILSKDGVDIIPYNFSPFSSTYRILQPQGYLIRRALYYRNTGGLAYMVLAAPATIDKLRVAGEVSFHPNEKMRKAEPAKNYLQSLHGISFDGSLTNHGSVEFYENGNPITIPSIFVARNAAAVPDDVVAFLPPVLDGNRERLQFFLNQAGIIRALVIESSLNQRAYTTQSIDGRLIFTELSESDELGRLLKASTRGYVRPGVMKYLRGIPPRKSPPNLSVNHAGLSTLDLSLFS